MTPKHQREPISLPASSFFLSANIFIFFILIFFKKGLSCWSYTCCCQLTI